MSDSTPVTNVRQFDPQTNSFGAIAPSGAFEIGELIRLIGGNFEGATLPAVTWDTNPVNGGTATVVDGELLLQTNTTADGQAEVQSVHRAEFVTATFNKAHLAFGYGSFAAADVICEFGMFDPITNIISGDGVFFRNDSGVISLVRRSGGVEVEEVAEASFNGNPVNIAAPTVKFVKDSNIHVYELTYNAGRIDFLQDRRLVHRMVSVGAVAYETTHLALGARIENINSNTTNNTLRTRGFACSRVGNASSEPDSITVNAAGSTLLKNSPGQLISIVITDTGVAGADLELYDDDNSGGTPFATLDLTASLVDLQFNRRLDNGLFIVAAGSAFEVLVNWR